VNFLHKQLLPIFSCAHWLVFNVSVVYLLMTKDLSNRSLVIVVLKGIFDSNLHVMKTVYCLL